MDELLLRPISCVLLARHQSSHKGGRHYNKPNAKLHIIWSSSLIIETCELHSNITILQTPSSTKETPLHV